MVTSKNPSPTRSLIIAPGGATEERYGGAGTSMARLFRYCPKSEVETTLLHAVEHHPFVTQFNHQIQCGNLPSGSSALSRMRFVRKGRKWITRYASNYDVGLVVTSLLTSLELGLSLSQAGIPFIARIENAMAGRAKRGWYGKLYDVDARRAEILRRANAIIAMSGEVANELVAIGVDPARIARIPQHCDTRQFIPAMSIDERSRYRDAMGWPDRTTLLCVGEVVPRKRQLLLIELLAQLIRRGHDIQLALVGPINNREYGDTIRARIQEFGLEDRVCMMGFTRGIQFAYRAADIFTLPSLNENMPNSLIEAMSSGLSPVISAFAGAGDCVQDGVSGHIIQGGAAEFTSWAETVSNLVEDGKRRSDLASMARRVVEKTMDSRLIVSQYVDLMNQASTEG